MRFAIDKDQFPDYSWRGYAVFSPIQEDVLLDVTVAKASLYRLLFHFVNPTDVQIDARIAVIPLFTHTQGQFRNTCHILLLPSNLPKNQLVAAQKLQMWSRQQKSVFYQPPNQQQLQSI